MKKLILALSVLVATGCSIAQYPAKRPLSVEHQQTIGSVPLTVNENALGVGVSWYRADSSATSAQYGFIGGLVGGIMDAIINSGPLKVANSSSAKLAEVIPTADLNQSLVAAIDAQNLESNDDIAVSIKGVSLNPYGVDNEKDKVVQVYTQYTLSQDASVLLVTSYAAYSDSDLEYKTPYQFEKKIPKNQIGGAVYTNSFSYYSERLPIPTLNDEMKKQMIEKINYFYQNSEGKLPVEGDDDYKKWKRALEKAEDDKLSSSETALFLIGSWIADEGKLIKSEVDKAHAFFAKQLTADLNRSDVPSFSEGETVVLESNNGRTVSILGSGYSAGKIESRPTTLSSEEIIPWGNTVAHDKANVDRISDIDKKNKDAKK